MTFSHDDRDWEDLLRVAADATARGVGMVEKDDWVCHALWAIHHQGFAVWFKGGTSLSKGFGLIERFSEDIDVRIDAGTVEGLRDPELPWVDSKKNRRPRGGAERDAWFDTLAEVVRIPGCTVRHYDDAARIVAAWNDLPPPELDLPALVAALATEDRKTMPTADHPAFLPRPEDPRWKEIAHAWARIGPMYWGPRVSLAEACETLRAFLVELPRA